MAGPTLPVPVGLTEAQVADMILNGENDITARNEAPEGSPHATHRHGQIRWNSLDESAKGRHPEGSNPDLQFLP